MPQDFFDTKPAEEEKPAEPIPVKVGEKEYSQEELSKIVGLGETAFEYETKWNRPIKDFYPDYTQKSQKLAEFEKRELEEKVVREKVDEEAKQKELDEKAKANQLSPEEMRLIAQKQARELGIVTKDEFSAEVNKAVASALSAKQLVDDVQSVIGDAEEKGQPKTNVADVLKYMDEYGVKSPEKAYKLMFESEIDQWKEEKLKGIQPKGMDTQTGSTAGAKYEPPAKPITRDNLAQVIRESLTRGRGVGV